MSEYDILTTTLADQSQVLFLEGLDDQEFWRYATKLASATPTTKVETEQYLECELGQERCILPLAALCEVVPPPHQITLLPSIPAWMAGITAWRGETIATIDLHAYLTQGPTRLRSDYILLVVQQGEITLGLFVAAVRSILTLDLEQMLPKQTIKQYPHFSAEAIVGTYANALVLDTDIILADIVQHIREVAEYG